MSPAPREGSGCPTRRMLLEPDPETPIPAISEDTRPITSLSPAAKLAAVLASAALSKAERAWGLRKSRCSVGSSLTLSAVNAFVSALDDWATSSVLPPCTVLLVWLPSPTMRSLKRRPPLCASPTRLPRLASKPDKELPAAGGSVRVRRGLAVNHKAASSSQHTHQEGG